MDKKDNQVHWKNRKATVLPITFFMGEPPRCAKGFALGKFFNFLPTARECLPQTAERQQVRKLFNYSWDQHLSEGKSEMSLKEPRAVGRAIEKFSCLFAGWELLA